MTNPTTLPRTAPRPCKHCGEDYVPAGRRGPVSAFCSELCRSRATRGRGTPAYERALARSAKKNAEARAARPRPDCIVCGSPVEPPRRTLCSDECKRKNNAKKAMEFQRAYKAEHGIWPARVYEKKDGAERYKSKAKARDAARNKAIPVRKRYPAVFAAKDARRRMKLAQATVEVFDPMEVFDRDRWVCQLCNEPVDRDVEYPDPGYRSLDHIVPISKGGEHSRRNTQLAHLGCNVAKSNRMTATAA